MILIAGASLYFASVIQFTKLTYEKIKKTKTKDYFTTVWYVKEKRYNYLILGDRFTLKLKCKQSLKGINYINADASKCKITYKKLKGE